MIGLSFRFPAGRYHATPWGRHVNEADVAWPPEPWRILRALIACYHRKADRDRFSEDDLAKLIDTLAEAAPVYRLPDAVHAHARHFMPAPVSKTLIFDAFARFDASEPILAAWPELTLDERRRALLDQLTERLGYLGRAESWVEAETFEAWPGGPGPNCVPQDHQGASDLDAATAVPVRMRASLSAGAYAAARERYLAHAEGGRRRTEIRKTLPERLVEALALDTGDLQAAGWSAPPASRELLYARPPLGPVPRSPVVRRHIRRDLPDTARYVLAGRPRPRIEETVKIGELARVAALSRIGYALGRDRIPASFSGRGVDGKPLKDEAHSHAFYLPEDADGDGEIDHLVIHVPAGIDEDCQRALDRLVRLWLEPRGGAATDDDDSAERGRKEWRLALEGFGKREAFAETSRLLAQAHEWVSATPYLMPWYAKSNLNPRWFRTENVMESLRPAVEAKAILPGDALYLSEAMRQIRRECEKRFKIVPERIEPCLEGRTAVTGIADAGEWLLPAIVVNGRPRRAVHFHRFRSRRGLTQPDTQGSFWRLTFAEPLSGPVALGFGCHFGLGLFRSE